MCLHAFGLLACVRTTSTTTVLEECKTKRTVLYSLICLLVVYKTMTKLVNVLFLPKI